MSVLNNTTQNELQSGFGKGRSKLASSIASPTEHDNLFEEGWAEAVKREGDLDSVV